MRQDTSVGIYNFPQTVAVTTETPLLVPSASGIYPSLPSPEFPLSTTSLPTGLFVGIPADIAGSVYDGHPFEVSFAAKITSTATTNLLVNLYNAKQSTFSAGSGAGTAGGYTLGTLGTGCTKVITGGTGTASLTASQSVNLWFKTMFIWDSTTKILSTCATNSYVNGGALTGSVTLANATAVGLSDLNFIPSFTFASAATTTINVTEFVINRL